MGEYAERKSDGVEVKIGTCESMYYLRYEDRTKVKKLENSLDPAKETGLFFRVPFPDEDKVQIGDYEPFLRGERLNKNNNDFSDSDLIKDPGTIQLSSDAGLLANVPCYHGEKLPANSDEVRFFWNGRSHHLELTHIKKHDDDKLWPVVRCQYCGKMWRYEWKDIIPYVYDEELQSRLIEYSNE